MVQIPETEKPKTLYQIVIDDIQKLIERGEFSFDRPICTENKLMEQYGISRITARRAMTELEGMGILYRKRGVGSFVARDIYQRTQKVSNNSNLFAFIFPFDVSRSGLSSAFQAANSVLLQNGCAASIYITEDDIKLRGRVFLNQLIHSDVAGVAYYPKSADVHLELLNHMVFKGKPVVLIDLPSPARYISSVSSTNFEGSLSLVEHLLSLGHKRIGYVAGVSAEARKTIADRMDGYVLGLSRAGIMPDPDLIVTTLTEEFRRSPGAGGLATQMHQTVRALKDKGATAVLCEHDQLAFEMAMACRDMQIKVPGDLSICGFDQSEWAQMLPEGITTVKQDMAAVGTKVAELLLAGVNAQLAPATQVVIPTQLVIGGTTGAAPLYKGMKTEGEAI